MKFRVFRGSFSLPFPSTSPISFLSAHTAHTPTGRSAGRAYPPDGSSTPFDYFIQHFLYFFPLPHGHCSFLPIFRFVFVIVSKFNFFCPIVESFVFSSISFEYCQLYRRNKPNFNNTEWGSMQIPNHSDAFCEYFLNSQNCFNLCPAIPIGSLLQ